jgi:putative isomerase
MGEPARSISPSPAKQEAATERVAVAEFAERRLGFGRQPESRGDRSVDALFDLASWVGWGLPDLAHAGSFVGPFDIRVPGWLGAEGLRFGLLGHELEGAQAYREPGLLGQTLDYGDLEVTLRLYFIDADRVVVSARISNRSEAVAQVHPEWTGTFFEGVTPRPESGATISLYVEGVDAGTPDVAYRFSEASPSIEVDTRSFRATLTPLRIPGDETRELSVQLSVGPAPSLSSGATASKAGLHAQRWSAYQSSFATQAPRPLARPDQQLALHCIETLIANWRGVSEDIPHEGLFPSWAYDGFHGYWAWDSWKHAVALSFFDPRLAKEQVRVMLDMQNDAGMVPDVIYPGTREEDNWRDTKPPLAAWAVETIFERDGDLDFVRETLPRLERYHRWWYAQRDHDGNGICEFGSTDGTRIAAAWESGMDNAVRFDDAKMVRNGEAAWSMDRESVDLNAYLVVEKRILARLNDALGDSKKAASHRADATTLGTRVRERHWDEERGWFRDRRLDGSFAPGTGPEGWLPLWAGIATQEQAQRVRETMVNPTKFGTRVPLGTLAADDPAFDPSRGYWRGPVWLDQAYFGIAGLRRYGYGEDADQLQERLLDEAAGLRSGEAIRENYHPITGEGLNARHFSWSAASILMMLAELPAPE